MIARSTRATALILLLVSARVGASLDALEREVDVDIAEAEAFVGRESSRDAAAAEATSSGSAHLSPQHAAAAAAARERPSITLFVEFFVSGRHPARTKDIVRTLQWNLDAGVFAHVYAVCDSESSRAHVLKSVVVSSSRTPTVLKTAVAPRNTFKDAFAFANSVLPHGSIAVFANGDISFDGSMRLVLESSLVSARGDVAFSLGGRTNIVFEGRLRQDRKLPWNQWNAVLNSGFSQDAWILTTPIRIPKFADFFFGVNSCDTRITCLLEAEGYYVSNPGMSIHSYHLHPRKHRYNKEHSAIRNAHHADPHGRGGEWKQAALPVDFLRRDDQTVILAEIDCPQWCVPTGFRNTGAWMVGVDPFYYRSRDAAHIARLPRGACVQAPAAAARSVCVLNHSAVFDAYRNTKWQRTQWYGATKHQAAERGPAANSWLVKLSMLHPFAIKEIVFKDTRGERIEPTIATVHPQTKHFNAGRAIDGSLKTQAAAGMSPYDEKCTAIGRVYEGNCCVRNPRDPSKFVGFCWYRQETLGTCLALDKVAIKPHQIKTKPYMKVAFLPKDGARIASIEVIVHGSWEAFEAGQIGIVELNGAGDEITMWHAEFAPPWRGEHTFTVHLPQAKHRRRRAAAAAAVAGPAARRPSMVLFVQFFVNQRHPARTTELLQSVQWNLDSDAFDEVVAIVEHESDTALLRERLTLSSTTRFHAAVQPRQTFRAAFEFANARLPAGSIAVFANGDISFDDTAALIMDSDIADHHDVAYALSRVDISRGGVAALPMQRRGGGFSQLGAPRTPATRGEYSQDAWVLRTPIRIPSEATFFFGVLAVDNRIACLLAQQGYYVSNPSFSVNVFHLHEVRHDAQNAHRRDVPSGPGLPIPPAMLRHGTRIILPERRCAAHCRAYASSGFGFYARQSSSPEARQSSSPTTLPLCHDGNVKPCQLQSERVAPIDWKPAAVDHTWWLAEHHARTSAAAAAKFAAGSGWQVRIASTQGFNLAEVRAYDAAGTAIPALAASMSSTFGHFNAAKCLDGDLKTFCQTRMSPNCVARGREWFGGQCRAEAKQCIPLNAHVVDNQRQHAVLTVAFSAKPTRVVVFNRDNACCDKRVVGAIVSLHENGQLVGRRERIAVAQPKYEFRFENAEGAALVEAELSVERVLKSAAHFLSTKGTR